MKIILITILAFFTFFESPYACFYFGHRVPPSAYPEVVEDFQREEVINGGISEISTTYFNRKRPRQHTISVRLDSARNSKNPESYLDLSTAKCSDENLKANDEAKLLKNHELKNKSGKKTGLIRICRDFEQNSDNYYLEMTNDNIVFFIRTNNLYGETEKDENLSLNELVEFTKNIPFNSNIDFELKLEAF